MDKRRLILTRNNNQQETKMKRIIGNPLAITEDEESIKLTGSTAAADMNFYFDQVKIQNTE